MRLLPYLARISLFCSGVLFVALGVSIATTAQLGTSPIAAIPYSLSLWQDSITFGEWVVIFNLSMVGIEWILLRSKLKLPNILIQIALTFLFAYCIDIFMALLADFKPELWLGRIGYVLVGSFCIALGASLALLSNISMLPGDGFVLAIALVSKKEVGRIRVFSDIAMSLTGIAICFLALGNMAGVREGTAIAAVVTGYFILIILKLAKRLQKKPDGMEAK